MDGEKAEETVGERGVERVSVKGKQNYLELEQEKLDLKSFQKSFNVRTMLSYCVKSL